VCRSTRIWLPVLFEGQDELSLSVEEDNHRALALYTKLGFRGLNLHGNAWTMHFRV